MLQKSSSLTRTMSTLLRQLVLCCFLFISSSAAAGRPLISSRLVAHLHQLSLPPDDNYQYAVIFDAGSNSSIVHVYCFDENMKLSKIGDDGYDVFVKITPGLSSYADNPEEAAQSLVPLLNTAIEAVPPLQHPKTSVRLGATAGLRLLPNDSADAILDAVSALLAASPFKFEPEWVSMMEGSQEGQFSWVSINYLLGNIALDYGSTVGIVNLGGGSVQMVYAISDSSAKNAPAGAGDEAYVTDFNLLGSKYHVYAHSYLGYGLSAGRAAILGKMKANKTCPCLPTGFQGAYVYNSVAYPAIGSASGVDYSECRKLINKALDISCSECSYSECTFDGVWSGGGGDGQKELYLASFLFDRAMQAGIISDPDAIEATVTPSDFHEVSKKVCKLSILEIGMRYPSTNEEDRPYFCLDLLYEYTLLVKGFGIDRDKDVTLVKQVKYEGAAMEAQWTLGSAIDVISSSSVVAE